MTKDEMVGWHHRVNGHEFEQTLGDNEGQASLAVHGITKNRPQLSNSTRLRFRDSLGHLLKVIWF